MIIALASSLGEVDVGPGVGALLQGMHDACKEQWVFICFVPKEGLEPSPGVSQTGF